MKVLYFTPFYPPQGEAAASRAYWFVKVLKEAGHSVKLLNASDFKLRTATNKDRAIIRLLKENLAGIELFFRVITSRNDFVILSSPPFFTVIWGAFGAILSGQKYLLDVRDLYPEIFFELGMIREDSMMGKFAKALIGAFYRRATGVMTVTGGLCSAIENYHAGRPLLVMNGYDPEVFFPGTPGEKFPRFTLVFHGTLGKVQNIATLLAVAEKLKSSEIDIIVAGEGPKAAELIAAKTSNIRYLGNLPISEIAPLLRKCHVGLSFRTDDKIGKEAFPVKVFEYVGTGLPIVMTPKCEAGDIITKQGLGYEFENKNTDLIAAKILDFKKNWLPTSVSHNEFSRREQARKILQFL